MTETITGRGKHALMPDRFAMTDIETMSTQGNAAILTIGVVLFDPRSEDTEETLRASSELFGPITFESNEKEGRHFSPATMAWWLQQSREAQDALFEGTLVNLRAALESFRQFIVSAKPRPTRIWANDCGLRWPFKFWESRSVRTIKELAYPPGGLRGDFPTIGVGTAHNAMDDSIRQALAVQHAYQVLDA
jgi:hypothetical protein